MKTKKQIYSALILIVIAVFFGAFSSQKETPKPSNISVVPPDTTCKILDKTDEFTKKRSVASGPYLIYTENINLKESSLSDYKYTANSKYKSTKLNLYVYTRWQDGKKVIGIAKYIWQVDNYLEFAENDPDPKMIFLLSNDSTLTIVPSTIEASELKDGGWVTQRAIFIVNDTIWSKLRDFPPKKFRIRYLGSNYQSIYNKDIIIDEKYQGEIPRAIKCIDDLNLTN